MPLTAIKSCSNGITLLSNRCALIGCDAYPGSAFLSKQKVRYQRRGGSMQIRLQQNIVDGAISSERFGFGDFLCGAVVAEAIDIELI
ncbi:hypothetical protein [Xylella fastidiosa]|uniref:Uncharacterized protein n=1 Tax=Xylella fastidiosa subsp. fastidiosa TaxID=644356 RepID=A0AAJ5R0M8_XYLFS|nr:hypothetical protein [Xylella fastidiosa]WCF28379.1 hypothetical protein OK117_00190 [Xylella fastidiosa subsp. fastidiosa]